MGSSSVIGEKVNCQPNIGRTSAPNDNRRGHGNTSIGERDVVVPLNVYRARAEHRSTGAPRAGHARAQLYLHVAGLKFGRLPIALNSQSETAARVFQNVEQSML